MNHDEWIMMNESWWRRILISRDLFLCQLSLCLHSFLDALSRSKLVCIVRWCEYILVFILPKFLQCDKIAYSSKHNTSIEEYLFNVKYLRSVPSLLPFRLLRWERLVLWLIIVPWNSRKCLARLIWHDYDIIPTRLSYPVPNLAREELEVYQSADYF